MSDRWKVHLVKWRERILKDGEADAFTLANTSGSPWTLEKLGKYLTQMFPDIEYSKKHKKWYVKYQYTIENSLSTLSPKEKKEMK